MMYFVFKTVFAAGIVAFSSWLSGKKPELAGFIIALPLLSLMVLPFSYAEYKDPAAAVKFAQSIFAGVPLSLLFFVPFLLATRLHWNFWALYGSGILLLAAGYFMHRWVMSLI